jgi:chloramphenicol 3-O-phosphotransferase
MEPGTVVLITGPAAVGKSTVARGLQAELGRNGALWLVLELDVFARALSRDWIAAGGREGRFAGRGFIYRRTDDGSIDLVLGAEGRRVLTAFHRSVAAIARSGVDLICETIIYDDADREDWSSALAGLSTTWGEAGCAGGRSGSP